MIDKDMLLKIIKSLPQYSPGDFIAYLRVTDVLAAIEAAKVGAND